MKKLIQWMLLAVVTAGFAVVCSNASAQPGGGGFANMDPQEMQKMIQQRLMEGFREQLAVTNDAEWNVIETRLSKVSTIRMQTLMGGLGTGMGMFRRGGAGGGGAGAPGGRGGGFMGMMGQANPEGDALQKAIDSNVPAEQLKRAMAQFREARKLKQAELAKAQAELREVLSTRQEAIMMAAGMLD